MTEEEGPLRRNAGRPLLLFWRIEEGIMNKSNANRKELKDGVYIHCIHPDCDCCGRIHEAEAAPPASGAAMRCNRCHRPMEGTTAYDGACECGGLIEAAPNPHAQVDYDRVAMTVASRIAARARCAECGKAMDRGAFDPEDQPASHPDKAGRALCLGCWQEGNALCAGCEMPFPHGELREDTSPAGSIFPPGDFYCPTCLAGRWNRIMPENRRSPELHRRDRRDPMLDEALRHEKAIDAILDEPTGWWTGSPGLADTRADQGKPFKVLKSLNEPGCAYCCRPAGDDGLCGECRYEHGE